MSATTSPQNKPPKESIKETLVSIIISFVLAFVCRGFVIEPFVIPTGSMAPTLMGAHMLIRSDQSGYTWPVGPWEGTPPPDSTPLAIQGVRDPGSPIVVHDPMTGAEVRSGAQGRRLRGGDRILVLKYLYAIYPPRRFDVVVFKNPTNPQENYIKRLIGLGGEQVALVDGDVFVRPNPPPTEETANAWSLPGWRIARKPASAQAAVWQPVFDSRYAPLGGAGVPGTPGAYTPPWVSPDRGWTIGGQVYTYEGTGPTELRWDATRPRYRDGAGIETWGIDDRTAYNELPPSRGASQWLSRFPVSDVRVRAGVEAAGTGLEVSLTIAARRHEFVAELSNGRAVIKRRGGGGGANLLAWEEMASGSTPEFAPGRVVNVEFEHVDQALRLTVNGATVCEAEYEWSPSERIAFATGESLERILEDEAGAGGVHHALSDPSRYTPVQVRWSFRGAGVKLHRVGLDRDLYYRAAVDHLNQRGRATHPSNPVVLDEDEFFCLGDNSPSSQDGRFLGPPTPWVAREMWTIRGKEPKAGVVPRDLLIGKAFFVYFPAMHTEGAVPVPDFGRMRFIR
jgi:signal peptidase I